MRTEELTHSPLKPLPALDKAVSMVVVYEDFPARLRMQKAFWLLTQKLSKEYDFECFWYGFADLKNSRVAAGAHAAAAAADLILFSVNTETEMPESVRTWVESWIGLKATQDAALAALLNKAKRRSRQEPAMPVWKYLKQIAQRAGMSFLPEIIGTEQRCAQVL